MQIRTNISDNKKISLYKLLPIILWVMVLELVIGGGGRLLPIGSVTFRILLYMICIPISVSILVIKRKVDTYVIIILGIFTIVLLLAIVLGMLNKALNENIFEDVKPLLFFYSLLFFNITILTEKDIIRVVQIIKFGALAMGVVYLLSILCIFYDLIPFSTYYELLEPSGEITWRGGDGLFIYKGFLYLCIGFFFCISMKSKWNTFGAFVLLLAIVLTLTRGFILSTLMVYILYLLIFKKNKWLSLSILLVGSMLLVIALPIYMEALGDRDESNSIRALQLQQVFDRTNIINIFLGNGFGIGVPISPVHMEISYLEIFCKQGLIGIVFWGGLISYISVLFVCLYKKKEEYHEITIPCFLSVLFVVFQSATNPFINNPIGLSIVLLTIVVFNRLRVL